MVTPRGSFFIIVVPSLIVVIAWHYFFDTTPHNLVCWKDYDDDERTVCRTKCDYGHFSLPWMGECRPWLSCDEISYNVHVINHLGNGAVKLVYLAQYEKYNVAYSVPLSKRYSNDFVHGQLMLKALNPSKLVVQLIGFCKNIIVTQYHKLGTAEKLESLLAENSFKQYDTLETRFKLCVNYAEILSYLHNSPAGVRVMCDSNDLQKTLGQFLLTDDLRLVVNDLDALPLVNRTGNGGVKCGHRQLYGDFVAPEQLWPYPDRAFNDDDMPLYDEKTDIWKVPDVCNYFLGSVDGADNIKFHLFKIHERCKSNDPTQRPTAQELVTHFKAVIYKLDL